MIRYINKPKSDSQIYSILNPIVRTWFKNKFGSFCLPQKYAVLNIHNSRNTLVSAVTGSGKTLTAFTSVLNELITLSEENDLPKQVFCIYISPLKALNNDIFFNLTKPLKEMEEIANKKFKINVAVRTGDTSTTEKSKMLKQTPHILITTPESLAILLNSPKFKEKLENIKYCIIDELHALADNKRGVHLSLSLERLQQICNKEIVRIGLSATSEPIEEIARFLVGDKRSCYIANIEVTKKMDLKVISPVPDLINVTHKEIHGKTYHLIDDLIQNHKTTLIFTNTRSATERVVHHLKEKFPDRYTENIGAHHGSLSKIHRIKLEERMRNGELKCIVCSTSLELGIDIGYIDLVILLGSPKSVARCTQRIGRSGHRLHDIIKGRIMVLDRDDLIECSVLLKNVLERNIDRIHIPVNCLDVLAQQIYGIAISEQIHINDLFNLITKSYCYKGLKKEDFLEVIKYLAGFHTSLEDRNVYAKIWYAEETGMIGKKGKLARVIYMTNIGTIPEESFVNVKVKNETIGHIDEGFLERLKRGDVFVLGGERYEFLYSKGMTAFVNASVQKLPTIPSWWSEMLPLNFDLALEIQRFRKLILNYIKNSDKEATLKFINNFLYVDRNASLAIYNYFREQFDYTKKIPNSEEILIEHCTQDDKKFVVFHTLYGRRVNDVLSRAIAFKISQIQKRDVEIGVNDNGFYLSSVKPIQTTKAFMSLRSDELYILMKEAIERTEVLKRRFRHCATRALMILRSYKGQRKTVGRQQVSSSILINAIKRISPDFPILKEAKREVLEDLMDIENAKVILKDIEQDKIKSKEIHTPIPSPFAFNLVLQGRLDVLKIEDKIDFLRRMHNMVLAKISLDQKNK